MRVRHVRFVVVRDAMTKIPRTGAAWELPLFEQIYGLGNIEDIQEFEVETDPSQILPPDEEMARLSRNYGSEKDTRVPHAEVTYGRGRAGVDALERAMRDAILLDEKPKAAKKTAKPADATKDEAGDGADNEA